jgi:hypothetical protein
MINRSGSVGIKNKKNTRGQIKFNGYSVTILLGTGRILILLITQFGCRLMKFDTYAGPLGCNALLKTRRRKIGQL